MNPHAQTHTQSSDNTKLTGILVLIFIFMLVISFQAKAQYSVTFGNKSHCDMEVKVTTCSNTANGATVPINSQVTVNVDDKVKFYEVLYGGILTITVYVGAPCAPTGVLHYPNECYVDFFNGGSQASGFIFDIW